MRSNKKLRNRVYIGIIVLAILITVFWKEFVMVQKMYNTWWGDFLESGIWFVTIPTIMMTVFYWHLPRYTAITFHDSEGRWLDVKTCWSKVRGLANGDTALWAKAKSGEVITGRFVTAKHCVIAENPQHYHVETIWFGKDRGLYYIVPVEVLDGDFLKKTERCLQPPVSHEELMTPPPYKMESMPHVEEDEKGYDPDYTTPRPPRRPSDAEKVISYLEEHKKEFNGCDEVKQWLMDNFQELLEKALESDNK